MINAINDAERQAFETILFKGIPGSTQKNALIENQGKAREDHKSYFENFFDQNGYKSFVMSSITSGADCQIPNISTQIVRNFFTGTP